MFSDIALLCNDVQGVQTRKKQKNTQLCTSRAKAAKLVMNNFCRPSSCDLLPMSKARKIESRVLLMA